MIQDLFDIFVYYWPKLLVGLWFAFFNNYIFAKYGNQRKHLLKNFIVLFFISSGFLSVVGEFIFTNIYCKLTDALSYSDSNGFLLFAICMLGDTLMVFIGGNLYTAYTGNREFLGATIYLEYVCVERLSAIMANTQTCYVVLYIIFQIILFLVQRKDLPFLFASSAINWKRTYLYLIGLFYVLDLLYGSFDIFPELSGENYVLINVLWLYGVALLNSAFVCGYLKASYAAAREHDSKLQYLKKLQSSQEDIIISLAQISEAKSGETGQHIRRVAEYSMLVAKTLRLPPEKVETIRIAAMMHDIGKLMINQDILDKPATLTSEEYLLIQQHAKYGGDLLAETDGMIMEMARDIAIHHHERWDGTGYPEGLRGNDISIYSQIVSVTDVYDALTSKRAYKDAWSPIIARKEIIDQRGKQFSPRVVDAFVECYDEIEEIRLKYADKA